MNHDRFGNPIDDFGHDILEDDFDPELYSDEELGFEEDDFPFELEYDEDFEPGTFDEDGSFESDLGNEY